MAKEYRISVNQDDWVSPEETLLDSGSKYSDMEQPISNSIFSFVFIIMSLMILLILIMTGRLSISQYGYFSAMSLQNSTANFFIPPPRGLIFDKNEILLAKNIPSFDVLVISREIKENQQNLDKNIAKIAEILKTSEDNLKNSIYSQIKQNSVFFAAENLSKDQLLAFDILSPKGFYVVPNVRRSYINGSEFSQIIGYVGKVNKENLDDNYYKPTDLIGRLGLEALYEDYLRGDHGQIFFDHENEISKDIDPKSGKNLILNIDFNLQKKLYSELSGILSSDGLDKGAAIIQNPNTGEILALVSFPSYDNNIFNSDSGLSSQDFNRLFNSKSKPLFNRSISGLYNPGSTIKPYMGMSILEENIFTPTDNIRDCAKLIVPNPYDPDNPAVFNNWRVDLGLFNLRRAIANSCNIYFFIGGGGYKGIKGLGVDKIKKYLHLGLADEKLGIDLPGEEKGSIPDPEWKLRERGENWYLGDTYNISIGQGDLLVTPLWINSYVSAIANGGTIYKPYIVNKITDQNKNTVASFTPQKLKNLPFSRQNISEVKTDMEETVLSGTAQIFKTLPVSIGAKTGTAEIIKGVRVNSLFTAFAPFNNPQLAITVLVEGSSTNQGLAIRTAYNVLKWYFEKLQ